MLGGTPRRGQCAALSGSIALGQVVSLMDTLSALCVKLLASKTDIQFPILQYVITYLVVCLVAAIPFLLHRRKMQATDQEPAITHHQLLLTSLSCDGPEQADSGTRIKGPAIETTQLFSRPEHIETESLPPSNPLVGGCGSETSTTASDSTGHVSFDNGIQMTSPTTASHTPGIVTPVASLLSSLSVWESSLASNSPREPKDEVGSTTTTAGAGTAVSSSSLWSNTTSPAQSPAGSPVAGRSCSSGKIQKPARSPATDHLESQSNTILENTLQLDEPGMREPLSVRGVQEDNSLLPYSRVSYCLANGHLGSLPCTVCTPKPPRSPHVRSIPESPGSARTDDGTARGRLSRFPKIRRSSQSSEPQKKRHSESACSLFISPKHSLDIIGRPRRIQLPRSPSKLPSCSMKGSLNPEVGTEECYSTDEDDDSDSRTHHQASCGGSDSTTEEEDVSSSKSVGHHREGISSIATDEESHDVESCLNKSNQKSSFKVVKWVRHRRGQVSDWLWKVFAVGTPAFYILMAFLDVQGGTLTVVAYSYANLASCCLIDWISLLTAFILSVKFMGEKATKSRIVALFVGLVGSLCILTSDSMAEADLSTQTINSEPPAALLSPSAHLRHSLIDPLVTPAVPPLRVLMNGIKEDGLGDHLSYQKISSIIVANNSAAGLLERVLAAQNIDIFPLGERNAPSVDVMHVDRMASVSDEVNEDGDQKSVGFIPQRLLSRADRLFGDLMCLLAAMFLGIVTVMMEKALVAGVPSSELLVKAFFPALIIGLVECLFFEAEKMTYLADLPVACWVYLFLAAVTMSGAYALAPLVLQRSSSSFFNLSLLTSAGLAVLFSAVLLGDPFPPLYSVGLVCILGSLIIYHHQ